MTSGPNSTAWDEITAQAAGIVAGAETFQHVRAVVGILDAKSLGSEGGAEVTPNFRLVVSDKNRAHVVTLGGVTRHLIR